jgi:hypothetical protein
VARRYSEFDALHSEIGNLLGPNEQALFPKKKWLAGEDLNLSSFYSLIRCVVGSKDESVVQERLEKLPEWLVAISRHPEVSLHPSFRAFLALDHFEARIAQEQAAANGAQAVIGQPSQPVELEAGHGQPGATKEVRFMIFALEIDVFHTIISGRRKR